MPQVSDTVWVNVNPSFREFDQPLLNNLSQQRAIAEWQYFQTSDEPTYLEVPLMLLKKYLEQYTYPVNLLGHGIGGLISWLYTGRYPERIKSLTLLSVGPGSAVDWQAHYYVQSNLLNCSRKTLLTHAVYNLFGHQSSYLREKYRQVLERDLLTSTSPHSLCSRLHLFPERVTVPLLVCRGSDDFVIDLNLFQQWKPWLKDIDRLWQCPKGRYFFHYSYPDQVSQQIRAFWQSFV